MTDPFLVLHATVHLLQRVVRAPAGADDRTTDRGAISLEQVLWFVAAGVSVAVVAAILWSQIRDQANTPVNVPTAP